MRFQTLASPKFLASITSLLRETLILLSTYKVNLNPSLPSSFIVGKHGLIILSWRDHTVLWPYPSILCFSRRHWLWNDWDNAESTHRVNPRKIKPCFVQQLCKLNSLFSKCEDKAGAKHPANENKLYLIPRTPNAWTVFSTSQVEGLSDNPQCSRIFPADTSSHLMGDCFKTSLCSYIVRTTLSLKLLADKNMFTSTYQSTRGKEQPLEGN